MLAFKKYSFHTTRSVTVSHRKFVYACYCFDMTPHYKDEEKRKFCSGQSHEFYMKFIHNAFHQSFIEKIHQRWRMWFHLFTLIQWVLTTMLIKVNMNKTSNTKLKRTGHHHYKKTTLVDCQQPLQYNQ